MKKFILIPSIILLFNSYSKSQNYLKIDGLDSATIVLSEKVRPGSQGQVSYGFGSLDQMDSTYIKGFPKYEKKPAQTLKFDWKVGDTKQIIMTMTGKEFKNEITTKDTAAISKSQISVLEMDGESYKIHLKTDNPLIKRGSHFYPDLSDKISNYTKISMHIKIYKDSLSFEVLDSVDYNYVLYASYDEILGILQSYSPDSFDSAKAELHNLYLSLKEKDEANSLIDFILDCYKVQYSEIDTLITTDSLPNPFNETKLIGTEVKTHVNKKSKNAYLIIIEKEYKFDAFRDLVTSVTDQLTSTINTVSGEEDNTDTENQIAEMFNAFFDSFIFKGYESLTIEKNNNSNWPISISKKIDLYINDGKAIFDVLIEIK